MRNLIHFFNEDTNFRLNNKNRMRSWISNMLIEEKKKLGDINIVVCSDDYLLEMNKKYLKHNYYTDIITFNNNDENVVSGDLFISIDRVKENARSLKMPLCIEIQRVIIHGVLHLVGYNDKNENEKFSMRLKEDYYLNLLAKMA